MISGHCSVDYSYLNSTVGCYLYNLTNTKAFKSFIKYNRWHQLDCVAGKCNHLLSRETRVVGLLTQCFVEIEATNSANSK